MEKVQFFPSGVYKEELSHFRDSDFEDLIEKVSDLKEKGKKAIPALISLSSELENISYQANNIYKSIQNAILEFSDTQSTGMI